MDVAGGTCDGANDAAALEPDEVAVLDAFPEPFAESVVRSWQFDTEITPRQSGSYRACGLAIDDGGYLAVAPVGTPITPADIRLNVPSFSSATGDPFDLVAGQRYRVLMRITNRGGPGVDNGADRRRVRRGGMPTASCRPTRRATWALPASSALPIRPG